MRGTRLAGAGALVLALAAAGTGPAHATDTQAAGQGRVWVNATATGTVAQAGDQVTVSCPAGTQASWGALRGVPDLPVQRTVYRSEAMPDRSGWVLRVESTERTAPWDVTAWVNCSEPPVYIPPAAPVFVEAPVDIPKADDSVVVSCPAGMRASIYDPFKRDGTFVTGEIDVRGTADGSGYVFGPCPSPDGVWVDYVTVRMECR